MRDRAQTGIELLMVVALSLVILLVLVDFTSTQFNQIQVERNIRTGRASVDQLTTAINSVYAQGPGASKQVSVIWPDGIESSFTSVSGHTIRIRINGTDLVGTTLPNVTGALPVNAGPQIVQVKAYDGFVALGSLQLSITPSFILARGARDTNVTSSFALTNQAGESVSLAYTLAWDHNAVPAVLVGGSSGSITAGGGVLKDVNFSPSSDAVGTYTGSLSVQGTFSSRVETQVIPLTLEVGASTPSDLSIYPTSISLISTAGDSNSLTLSVCNVGGSPISELSFTPSSSGAGAWIQGIPDVNSIAASGCTSVDVNVVVPSGTAIGTSVGLVSVRDYSGAHTATLSVSILVRGMNQAFDWDWSAAGIGVNNVSNFTLTNNGSIPLTITSMTPRTWWTCDSNDSYLSTIRLNNTVYFSGFVGDGSSANVTDFNLPVLTSWTNNALIFAGTVNDQNERFSVDVFFSDGTQYSSGTFGTGC